MVKNLPCSSGDIGSNMVWEDPMCHRATKQVCHDYPACVLQQPKPACTVITLIMLPMANNLKNTKKVKRKHAN